MNDLSQIGSDEDASILSQIDNELLNELQAEGHTPEEAAKILLDVKNMILEACQQLLEGLTPPEEGP